MLFGSRAQPLSGPQRLKAEPRIAEPPTQLAGQVSQGNVTLVQYSLRKHTPGPQGWTRSSTPTTLGLNYSRAPDSRVLQNKQAKPKLSIGPTPGADIKVSI